MARSLEGYSRFAMTAAYATPKGRPASRTVVRYALSIDDAVRSVRHMLERQGCSKIDITARLSPPSEGNT